MPDVLTDIVPIETDAFFTDATTGERIRYYRFTEYDDRAIAVDVADMLAEGETLSAGEVTPHLVLWKSTTESAHTDEDDLMVGVPTVSGTEIRQRVAGLTPQRWYRLYLTFGPTGNKRTVTALIRVMDSL
jgi:hypothetical protein